MSAAYFIVLEQMIDGLDTDMDGKSLSRHIEALDEAAEELGVTPLSAFFSTDPEQAAEFLGEEGIDAGDIEMPSLQQFTAEEGLAALRALQQHSVAQTDGVAIDLQECTRILETAAQHGIGWHFEIDF